MHWLWIYDALKRPWLRLVRGQKVADQGICGVTGNWWCVSKSQCVNRRIKDCWAWSAWGPWSAFRRSNINDHTKKEKPILPKGSSFCFFRNWCHRFRNMDSSWNASPKPARSCWKLEQVWSEVDCWSFGMWTFGARYIILLYIAFEVSILFLFNLSLLAITIYHYLFWLLLFTIIIPYHYSLSFFTTVSCFILISCYDDWPLLWMMVMVTPI